MTRRRHRPVPGLRWCQRARAAGAAVFLLAAGGSPALSQAPTAGDRFTERIPGTTIRFEMAFAPAGSFLLGSPEGEAGREADEGPRRTVSVAPRYVSHSAG